MSKSTKKIISIVAALSNFALLPNVTKAVENSDSALQVAEFDDELEDDDAFDNVESTSGSMLSSFKHTGDKFFRNHPITTLLGSTWLYNKGKQLLLEKNILDNIETIIRDGCYSSIFGESPSLLSGTMQFLSFSDKRFFAAERLSSKKAYSSYDMALGIDYWLAFPRNKSKVKEHYLVFFDNLDKNKNSYWYNMYLDNQDKIHIIDLMDGRGDIDVSSLTDQNNSNDSLVRMLGSSYLVTNNCIRNIKFLSQATEDGAGFSSLTKTNNHSQSLVKNKNASLQWKVLSSDDAKKWVKT